MDRNVPSAIGRGLYGPSFDEAHAEGSSFAHIAEEQDKAVERILLSLSANRWALTHNHPNEVRDDV